MRLPGYSKTQYEFLKKTTIKNLLIESVVARSLAVI